MSSPIAIPSSKATSYASAVASSPTTSVIMGSLSSSPRSAGVYIPVHKRLSASPPRALPSEAASSLPRSQQFEYTSSFLLSLRPTAERFHEQIESRIRASLEPELANLLLMGRKMKKGSASRKTTKKSGGVRQSTATPSSSSLPLTSTSTSTPTPLSTKPAPSKPTFTLPSKKTLAPRRTRSSSMRARPPRQPLRLSRNASRVMNSRESWRVSGAPASTSVVV